MRKLIFIIITIFLAQAALAKKTDFQYKVINNQLEVFGYRLSTNHLPKGNSGHYVIFSESPDSRYIVILSYLHLEGKYDAWLFDTQTKLKPEHINATYVGRHPVINWYSNEIFSLAWAGMGYYTAGIFNVSNVNNGLVVEDPVIVDGNRHVYISYVDDVFKTGIVVGSLFTDKDSKELFYFKLPETDSVMDRYESITDVKIINNAVVIEYLKDGKPDKYEFHPKILEQK